MIGHAGDAAAAPDLRADARRNRDRILIAARDIFVDQGYGAPLDAIAARAGVGIATLYRRFPNRRLLAHAVVFDVLSRVADEAQRALTEEPDAFRALARYMHRALDLRVSAVIPSLLAQGAMDHLETRSLSQQSAKVVQEIIDRAQAEGSLRPDITFGDIGLLLSRLAHPLPGPIPRTLDNDLAHRHLALVLQALQADRTGPPAPLPGPALTLADLHAVTSRQTNRPAVPGPPQPPIPPD